MRGSSVKIEMEMESADVASAYTVQKKISVLKQTCKKVIKELQNMNNGNGKK